VKNSTFKGILLITVLFLSSCAAGYHPINPPTVHYTAHDVTEDISFSYKYDVLMENSNKKYARKEDKQGVRLIAVKLTNNTSQPINVSNDLTFYSGENQVLLMAPATIKALLKQSAATSLLFLALTPFNLIVISGNSASVIPVGLVLGPAMAIGNTSAASGANKKFYRELVSYNILEQNIQPGETIYGLIGIRETAFNPLYVELKRN